MPVKFLNGLTLTVASSLLKTDASGVVTAAVAGTDYINTVTSSMVTTALGYTPVPTTRTLTINGTALDLSANRSWTISTITGNAGSATVLQTARNINGTSFNGSADITTANWGTARTITIGSTGKSVNGSGNVAWTLAEIGAQAAGSYLTTSVGLTIDVNAANGTALFTGSTNTWTNRGPAGNNAGALFSINTHPGNFYSQFWFDTAGGGFYHRTANNVLPTGAWQRVYADNYRPVADAWTTARTITIGSTGKSVNGSENVSWSLAEIGAYAATNPSGYTSNTGTVTSVAGTGGYGGLTLSGTVTTSGNITLGGTPTGTWPISISGNAATATSATDSTKLPLSGGTMTGALTVPRVLLTNDASDTFGHRVAVYDSGGTSYGMMLWNTSGTGGAWSTMIYGPNQANRRISFGKINTASPTNHSHITEIAYFDLDNSYLYINGRFYPSGQTTNYVDSTRISNWQTAYGWGNHADYGYWDTTLNDPKDVQSSLVRFQFDVEVVGTFTESSSIRFKENIVALEPTLEKVTGMKPVTYNKIGSETTEVGLIAEEVAELFPDVVTYNEDGQVQGIQYQRLSVILLKAVQELTERVNKLENK